VQLELGAVVTKAADAGDAGPTERARHLRLDPGAIALEWFEGLLRKVVRDELAAANHPVDNWRDQHQSRLSPRKHCLAVRRRLEANPDDPSAKHVGDKFLLTPDAVAEELDRLGHKPDAPAAPRSPQSPESEALERVQRRLRRKK
jgi:hypothetical protein